MNSTTTPCPYEDRRTSTELYVKLGIFLPIITCSLIHLIYLRREYQSATVLVLTGIASPITVAIYLAFPIPFLLAEALIYRDKDRLLRSIGALAGRLVPEDARESAQKRPNTIWTWVQRVLLSAVLFLSVSSIFFFTKRPATALFDHYILQLALLGVLTSLLSLVQLSLKIDTSKTWLTFIAGRYDSYWCLNPSLLIHLSILGLITASIAHACGLNVKPAFSYFTAEIQDDTPLKLLKSLSTGMGIYCSWWVGVGLISSLIKSYRSRKFDFSHALFGIVLFITLVPTMWILIYLYFLAVDMIGYIGFAGIYNAELMTRATDYLNHTTGIFICPNASDWNMISTFSANPVSCPCPVALRSGIADLVWLPS